MLLRVNRRVIIIRELTVNQCKMEIREKKILSFGEQLVGIEFNPSSDDTVTKVKSLYAEIAEIMKKNYEESRSPMKSLLFDQAVGDILRAQMMTVKVVTMKNTEDNE